MGIAGNLTCDCSSGLILPLINECDWSDSFRAFVYLLGLLYSFLGIAIAADVFMCAIEKITCKTKRIRVEPQEVGTDLETASLGSEEGYREVQVWNPTVANLTLMALGSSAPEILLSIIEIIGNDFHAGELGPGTIVGSAAFNLLVISGICITAIPSPDIRRINAIYVFGVTASFAILAYLWLLIILIASSKDIVDGWEAVLTLIWFVVLIVLAYLMDTMPWKRLQKTMKKDGKVGLALSPSLKEELWKELEKEVIIKYPNLPPEDMAKLVASKVRSMQPHDRLYYRIQATRWMDGRRSTLREEIPGYAVGRVPEASSLSDLQVKSLAQPRKTVVEFSARIYAFGPAEQSVRVKLIRRGRHTNKKAVIRYETVSGSAEQQTHFVPKKETVIFSPGDMEKLIVIDIVPESKWENQQGFFVHLHLEEADKKTKIGSCAPAVIRYSDHTGVPTCEFERHNFTFKESSRLARLPVQRISGDLSTPASVYWSTKDVTAQEGMDYIGGDGVLHFDAGEALKYVDVPIIDDLEEEKTETFEVDIIRVTEGGVLGNRTSAVVAILSDDGVKEMFTQMDKLIPNFLDSMTPGAQTWRQQILAATSVNGGDTQEASGKDIVSHVICFPFKVIFSLVPPPSFCGGWLTFFIALALIGLLTAIVGDLASIFGCLVGLKDPVTAITFVALGTSLPDTFASRLAAVQEPTADNSIGNITGSNSVNVFLGLGIPWLMAAIYWEVQGKKFRVESGNIGFTVMIYSILATICIALLMARRYLGLFGKAELGGPVITKWASGIFLFFLWFLYVLLSSLQVYGHI